MSTSQLGMIWDHLVLATVLGPEELVVQVCIPQNGGCWMPASISGLLGCQCCKIGSSASKELQAILFSPAVITRFLKTYGLLVSFLRGMQCSDVSTVSYPLLLELTEKY